MRSLRAILVPAMAAGALWSVPPVPAHPGPAVRHGPTASPEILQQALPAGVTEAMVREGEKLYSGAGLCSTCHGPDGKGIPRLAEDLTDARWRYSDGSYSGIVSTIEKGVSAEQSTTGIPFPPRAGANLSDAQVKAVAAYVWTLSHHGG